MEKKYVTELLTRCQEWKTGDSEDFTVEKSYGTWTLTLKREDDKYAPLLFAINGIRDKGPQSWSRRYRSAEDAVLHVLNDFNENANIKDPYSSIKDFLKS